MLRIMQGRYRGQRLPIPPRDVVRPMGQRMREAVFNILEHRYACQWDKTVVLDAFAGSGSLGFEALSRGARHVYFVEKDQNIYAQLQKNTQEDSSATVMNGDAARFYSISEKAKVLFVDPPFGKNLLSTGVQCALEHADPSAVCVVQKDRKDTFTPPQGWYADTSRTYTYKVLLFLRPC